MDQLRFMTAGHVDDGKSTLIGRLFLDHGKILKDQLQTIERASRNQGKSETNLALFTDGLKAEREKGITIDVAYRYFSTQQRKFIIADAPGHYEYTRNMVTAASQVDAAVILVDATRGMAEQTRRHAWLIHWLGVRNIVFALNKMDLLDYSEKVFREREKEIIDWIKPIAHGLDFTLMPIAALKGDNILRPSPDLNWYTGKTLDQWLHETPARSFPAAKYPTRLSIQGAVSTIGDSENYTGTLASGVLTIGDELHVAQDDRIIQVQGIWKSGQKTDQVQAGEAIQISLSNGEKLSRGQLLEEPEYPTKKSNRWLVEFCAMTDDSMPMDTAFFARHFTSETPASFECIDETLDLRTLQWAPTEHATLTSPQIGRGVLSFASPITADAFGSIPGAGRMILIRESDHATAVAVLLKEALPDTIS